MCSGLADCPSTCGSCQGVRPSGTNKSCLPNTSFHYSEGTYEGGFSCADWEPLIMVIIQFPFIISIVLSTGMLFIFLTVHGFKLMIVSGLEDTFLETILAP